MAEKTKPAISLAPDARGTDAVRELLGLVPLPGVAYRIDGTIELTNTPAVQLLGLQANHHSGLRDTMRASRCHEPDILVERLVAPDVAGPSFHLVEDADGEPLCMRLEVHNTSDEGQRIAWFTDVTDVRRLDQFRLLADIGRVRGQQTTAATFGRELVDAVVEILNFDVAVLMVRERDSLRPIASRGMLLEPSFTLSVTDSSFVSKAIERQVPVISDGSEWGSGLDEMTGHHHIVPLVVSGECVGSLHLSSIEMRDSATIDDPGAAFEVLDASFLSLLSAYAGAALANTRLFERIGQEEAKLSTLVEAMPLGVVVYNGRGEVLLTNHHAHEIVEFEWSNLNTDTRPYRLRSFDGEILPRAEWPFFRAVRTDNAVIDDVVVLDFGLYRKHISVSVVPVLAQEVTTYVGTIKDVSDQVRTQKRREQLLSVTSHELRSPLTPLIGFLQMLRKQAEQGSPVEPGLLLRAEGQVQRLARLIETMLDLSRLENDSFVLKLESTDLRDLVHGTVDFWSAHPKGVLVEAETPPEPVIVSVDADRVEQVLANLIDNAVKHSQPGARVLVLVEQSARFVTIEVKDQGHGIPEESIARVFDRFFSRSDGGSQTGLGLGLFVCREIIDRHGGTVWLSSEEGQGTTVRVRLPQNSH